MKVSDSHAGPRTKAAERAVDICKAWATKVAPSVGCQFHLFGSAIYKGGEQFDPIHSDLDIVCHLPRNGDALWRANTIKQLHSAKLELELNVIRDLSRVSCTDPAVSIVVATPLEIDVNIHKSATRTFFDRNTFSSLEQGKESLGLGGASIIRNEDLRQALELVQRVRHDYLSVCANGTGGLPDYFGPDPIPKHLLRSAAQVVAEPGGGEWYDTKRGLVELDALLKARRAESPVWDSLFEKISIRRGARGQRESLSDHEQLLLSELLYDKAVGSIETEPLVNWGLRFVPDSQIDPATVFRSLLRLVPDAKQVPMPSNNSVLAVRTSETGERLCKQLFEAGLLSKLLDAPVLEVGFTPILEQTAQSAIGSRENRLVAKIGKWKPRAYSYLECEQEFAEFLLRLIQEDPNFGGAQVLRDAPFAGVEVPFSIDFLFSWASDFGRAERIGVEFVCLHNRSTFFYKASQVLPLGRPVILVIYGAAQLIEELRADTGRLEEMNRNIKIVKIVEDKPS